MTTPKSRLRWTEYVSSLVASAALLAGCASSRPASHSQSDEYSATVTRTEFGIPHIRAADWGGLGYGYGYAIAEDNLCTMADAFVTYRGERSKYFGAEAKPVYLSTLESASNLDSDVFFRALVDAPTVAAYRGEQEREFTDLVAGFAAGYSRYVREIHDGAAPGRHLSCRNAPWLGEIDSDDIYRRLYTLGFAHGVSRMVVQIATAAPPESKTSATSKTPPQWHDDEETLLGSNAIAFGGDATGSNHGLLFGNPHWFWDRPDRFYQVHLQMPGRLNVQGASIMGVPLVVIGFNEHVAWTHTVSTARRFTTYRLQLVDGDATSYVHDGKARKLEARTIEVPARRADGSIGRIERTIYRSHFGPMLANGWDGRHAFTVRAVNSENARSYRNWMRWNQAGSLDEFIRIQREEVAIPWVNTLAAGRNDTRAWYADIGAIPNVPDALLKECEVALFTLDGSRQACEWRTDADSVQPGAFGVARLPSLARPDYVANMNDSFWLANPEAPLTGFPKIIGDTQSALSYRSRLGYQLVREAAASGHRITNESVRRLALDTRSLTAQMYLDAVLRGPCARSTDADVTDACHALATWDRHGENDSRGAHVWDTFWMAFERIVPLGERYRVAFDAQAPLDTPRQLNADSAGIVFALASAAKTIATSPYPPTASRAEYQFLEGSGAEKIPLPGGCGFNGYITASCTRFENDQVVVVPGGNSYLQVVSFDDSGPQAWTLMASSQSSDPSSPHYRDYSRAYSTKQWHRTPFTDAEVATDAVEARQLTGH